MERRNFLAGTGVMAMTALAGCSGDGTDDANNGGESETDEQPTENNTETESEPKTESEPEIEEETEDTDPAGTTDSDEENHGKSEEIKNSVEILEHELVRENEGAVSETVRVEGRAENVGDSSLTIAEIRVQFFNKIGDIIASSIDNVIGFKPGQTWAFIIRGPLGERAAEIDEYNISVGTTISEPPTKQMEDTGRMVSSKTSLADERRRRVQNTESATGHSERNAGEVRKKC